MSSIGSNDALGKDQFLKLFTTQAKTQNPMNPQETTDFLAQLAQFTSVEQMSNLNTNLEQMLSKQETARASDLVGKSVQFTNPIYGDSGEGLVTGVRLGEKPQLLIGNRKVSMDWVTGVYAPTPADSSDSSESSDSTGSSDSSESTGSDTEN